MPQTKVLKFQKLSKNPLTGKKSDHRSDHRVKFKLKGRRWRPRNMQFITDFFKPKTITRLSLLPEELNEVICEYSEPRLKKPLHGKIMKDFLNLFWKELHRMGLYDEPAAKLNGLYIGKNPRECQVQFDFHGEISKGYNLRGKYIGFHWQWYVDNSSDSESDSDSDSEWTAGNNNDTAGWENFYGTGHFVLDAGRPIREDVAYFIKHTSFHTPNGSYMPNFVPPLTTNQKIMFV